ncbi:MAG TPA: RDD family protein [Anaerolineae bacterium]|nr:RDD family protein [Anaerolineae bacterium]
MNHTDEILSIDTPENVIFGYSLAGLGSRFLAAVIDSAIIFLIQAAVLLITFYFIIRPNFAGDLGQTWAASLLSLLAFVFFWGYYIFFELNWNGQSPGKRMVGIRVIRRDGTPVTLSEVLIRNLVRLVDFLPSFYGVGVIAMFADGQSRRLGDLAAGTLVIHDSGPLAIESVSPAGSSNSLLGQAPAALLDFPLAQLTNADLQFLEEYIGRRRGLSNRRELSWQVLKRLYARVGMPDQPLPEHPDLLLDAILQAARAKSAE